MPAYIRISLRYFLAKRKLNFLNLVVYISIFSIAIAAMAMLIVLSAFNGLDDVIRSLYSSFDPQIKIEASKAKTFSLSEQQINDISNLSGVVLVSKTAQEMAYINYEGSEKVVLLKGVDANFDSLTSIVSTTYEGTYDIEDTAANYAFIGYGIAREMNLFVREFADPVQVYAIQRSARFSNLNPSAAFRQSVLYPTGIYAINQDFDAKYILVNLAYFKRLFGFQADEYSALELKLDENTNKKEIAQEIQTRLGNDFKVQTIDQLNELIYKTNKTEKWITYCILIFVLIVAAMNLIASVTMMILDKKKELKTLKAIGLSFKDAQRVFIFSGFFIAFFGALLGVLLGAVLVLIQQHIGLLALESSVVEFYPVALSFLDVFTVLVTVSLVGYLFALLSSKIMLKKHEY